MSSLTRAHGRRQAWRSTFRTACASCSGGRLARLPGETLDVLLLTAALARPTIDLVAAAHGDRSVYFSSGGWKGLREEESSSSTTRGSVSHTPCSRRSADERAPLWKRRAVHRELADAVTDVEERTRHLALAADGPDAVIASELDTAAEQAAGRGATAAAAELYELAAELTPTDPALARERRLRSANFHFLAGDRERSVGILDQLLTEVPAGLERADVSFALAGRSVRPASEDRDLRGGPVGGEGDDARSARILGFGLEPPAAANTAALGDARAALGQAERVGDPALIAAVIGRVAQIESSAAEVTPGLVERGVEIEDRWGSCSTTVRARASTSAAPDASGGDRKTSRLLEELERNAAARGDEGTRAISLWYLSTLEWFAGGWQQALGFDAAQELASQITCANATGWIGRVRAWWKRISASSKRRGLRSKGPRRVHMGGRERHLLQHHARGARPARAGAREPGGGKRPSSRGAGGAARERGQRSHPNGLG